MSDSTEKQIRDLQREIDALSATQALAPDQITTYSHVVAAAGSGITRRATFPGGLKLFQAYLSDNVSGYMDTAVSGNVVTFTIWASAGSVLTVTSLSEFNLG